MTVPAYAIACACTLIGAFSSDRNRERGFHVAIPTTVACIGYILLIITKDRSTVVRYCCLTLVTIGNFAAVPPLVIQRTRRALERRMGVIDAFELKPRSHTNWSLVIFLFNHMRLGVMDDIKHRRSHEARRSISGDRILRKHWWRHRRTSLQGVR